MSFVFVVMVKLALTSMICDQSNTDGTQDFELFLGAKGIPANRCVCTTREARKEEKKWEPQMVPMFNEDV